METYLARLPRIVAHVSLMLQDRGFAPLPVKHTEDFVQLALDNQMSIGEVLSSRVKHTSGSVLFVCFLDPIFDIAKGREVMTSSFQLHGALQTLKEDETALIISFAKLSPDASREAAKLKRKATVLTSNSLAFPLSKHVMIPKHIALTSEETVAWETQHKLSRFKLPVLRMTDPVRVWFGWPKGTLVRIERPSGMSWRVVK